MLKIEILGQSSALSPFSNTGATCDPINKGIEFDVRSSTKHEDDQGTRFPAVPESLSLKH